ncbi:MAG: DUF4340 domain-containing protein [Litorilinea sp.]
MTTHKFTSTPGREIQIGQNRLRQPAIWLGLLLVGQLLLVAIAYWPSGPVAAIGGPLLPDLDPAAVQQIQIEGPDNQSVTLVRAATGWAVAETDDYPATHTKIDELLGNLAAANTNRLVTQTATSHSRLQVAADNFNRRITLTTGDDATHVVYLGIAAGGAATHVRTGDADTVYLSGQLAPWELEPFLSGWVNTRYVTLSADTVTGLRLETRAGTLTLERTLAGSWQAAPASDDASAEPESMLDAAAVDSLLSRLTFLSFQDVLGQTPPVDFATQPPTVRVELTVQSTDAESREDTPEDGRSEDATPEDDASAATRTVVLEIAPLPSAESTTESTAEAETYFVKSSESDYYVTVGSQTVDALADLMLDDLLGDTATPGQPDAPIQPNAPPPESISPDEN